MAYKYQHPNNETLNLPRMALLALRSWRKRKGSKRAVGILRYGRGDRCRTL
ncbi:unnamed protein product [Camellia sinensis]